MYSYNPYYEKYLAHYGVKHKSGRYPWGSGDRPYQGESFYSRVKKKVGSAVNKTANKAKEVGSNIKEKGKEFYNKHEKGVNLAVKIGTATASALTAYLLGQQIGAAVNRSRLKDKEAAQRVLNTHISAIASWTPSNSNTSGLTPTQHNTLNPYNQLQNTINNMHINPAHPNSPYASAANAANVIQQQHIQNIANSASNIGQVTVSQIQSVYNKK